jgi:hypothetical protein
MHRPQLPVVSVLQTAVAVTIPALLHAHPAVAAAQISTTTEAAAYDVVRLAQFLRTALANYRRVLRDADEF